MSTTKEIVSVYTGKESVIDLLFTLLSGDRLYAEKIQRFAENLAEQMEVADHV